MSFFWLSKIFWLLAQPSHIIVLLGLLALVLLLAKQRRAGAALGVLFFALFFIAGVLPTGQLLLRPLE